MFLVGAKKSRTFFSFPYSANEQVGRSWEGAQPGSQPKLANGNTPYHGRHAQCINGGWLGDVNFSMSSNFSVSLGSSAKFASSTIAAWGLAAQLVIWW